MKQVFTLLLVLLISLGLHAQSRNDLRGPAAKNYRPQANNTTRSMRVKSENRPNRMVGPSARRENPRRTHKHGSAIVSTKNRRKGLKGPAAKNYRQNKRKRRSWRTTPRRYARD